jgi:kynurenine 3-monooxygenase
MNPRSGTVTLIGAGLNGPLLALGLLRRGLAVQIFERRPDMRLISAGAGRSINLALSRRGIHALSQAGLWKSLQQIVIPMKGRMMHSLNSGLTFQPYGKNETEVIYSISRADLNIALINAAEKQGAKIRFSERCTGVDLKSGVIRLRHEDTGVPSQVQTEVLIGCDGSSSAIRNEMLRLSRFNFSQQYLDYGYKELTIPAGAGGKHQLEINALHIWPRGNYMLIALPNIDGTFACILFLPFEGPDSFAQLTSESNVMDFFQGRFPDAVPLMPNLAENFFSNPTGTMVTIKCSPWNAGGRALLLGDAAHAIVPFFGQGINAGFEDCTQLLELLDSADPDIGIQNSGRPDDKAQATVWSKIFSDFSIGRKVNTDAIADLALENFVEMRDRVADPGFLFLKKVELALEEKYPQRFVPKYAMVTFHRVPYATALKRGLVQDRLLTDLCGGIQRIEDLDWSKADRLIHQSLTNLDLVS